MFERIKGNKKRGEAPSCSDRSVDRNPNPYPVDRRRVESRTISKDDISCNSLRDQVPGSDWIVFLFSPTPERHMIQSLCSDLWAAKAAPWCFSEVSVLMRRSPEDDITLKDGTTGNDSITEDKVAQASFVKSHDPICSEDTKREGRR